METLQRTANRGSISTGYDVANSISLERRNSQTLQHTYDSAPTNLKKNTLSMWFKRTEIGVNQGLYQFGDDASGEHTFIRFTSANDQGFLRGNFGSNVQFLLTTQSFRDTSAWYHLVVAWDTTQSTASDRLKVYLNGAEVTAFDTDNRSSVIPLNHDTPNGENGKFVLIGEGVYDMSCYIAETHFVDGQALAPTDFGEYDEDSGIWKPKQYTGTYGNNGFYLDFENSSNLGEDKSGNNHDFTLNNVSASDQATDTPTNNFATLNPLWNVYNEVQRFTLTEGGTTITGNQSQTLWRGVPATIPVNSGKWYWEVERGNTVNGIMVGAGSIEGGSAGWVDWRELTSIPSGGKAKMMYSYNMGIYGYSASQDAWEFGGGNFNTAGDIISVALDLDNGYMYFRKNGGAWLQSGDPSSGSSGTGAIGINWDSDGDFTVPVVTVPNNTVDCRVNFGGYTETSIASGNSDANGYGNFEYAVPSGYYAICTKNVAEYG